jgi:cyclopropane fatty-acyl-phospholipid synthase-like methyltransferase
MKFKEEDYLEINMKTYDILANEYREKYDNDNEFTVVTFPKIITEMKRMNPEKKQFKVLEIGPGSGDFSNYMAKEHWDITAVELSKNMAKLTKKLVPTANVINANINDMDFDNGLFDFIVAIALVHNFPDKDLNTLIDNMKKWIKNDGVIILTTTKENRTEKGYYVKKDYLGENYRYRQKWKKEDFEKMIYDKGFKISNSLEFNDEIVDKIWLVYFIQK